MAETLSMAVNVPLEMEVKYCDLVASKHPDKYPSQVKFKAANGETLYLDNPAALKCLFNAGAIAEIPAFEDQSQIPPKGQQLKLATKKLTFLRTQAPKEKAITLSINGFKADSEPAAAPPESASRTTAVANGNGREKRSAIYLAMTEWVLEKIVPLYEAKEIPVSANDVHGMVATLFIAETRN